MATVAKMPERREIGNEAEDLLVRVATGLVDLDAQQVAQIALAQIQEERTIADRDIRALEQQVARAAVSVAIGTLSYSETQAVVELFRELNGTDGILVASKIADRIGITRSVIVNALRKLESAGVIESRSLGMKGTYVRILNDRLVPELQKAL